MNNKQLQPQGHPAEGYPQQAYVAPPPAGYPMKDGEAYPQQAAPVETKSRGDGFWKGWKQLFKKLSEI
ncbi:hypothetical protein QJS04_geneDACA023466 [Acorus gramineus]|uniref:Uncharacterized protein n=1 Tax=Acorus gramineus TaxID=55184 RepID=A0AAV9BSZ9_ACOGR|nr:hypothetical protein QJS04_geneDACA023466 [Acorus gramineus]